MPNLSQSTRLLQHVLQPCAYHSWSLYAADVSLTTAEVGINIMSYLTANIMQVDNLSKAEFFGDMCLTKRPAAPATAVTGNVTTTLLVVSKYVSFQHMSCIAGTGQGVF